MTDFNPYQPPKADLLPAYDYNPIGIQRMKNKQLFVPNGVNLPNRCIKCNQATDNQKSVKLKKSYALLIIVSLFISSILLMLSGVYSASILIYLYPIISIIVAIFQKKVTLQFSLCDTHARKRLVAITLSFLTFIGSLGGYVYLAIKDYSANVQIVLFILIPLSLIFFAYHYRLIKLVQLTDEGVYIKGFGKAFLESFDGERFEGKAKINKETKTTDI